MRILKISISCVLLLATMLSPNSWATSGVPPGQNAVIDLGSTTNKIDGRVLDKYKQDEQVTYLVKLRKQVDAQEVARQSTQKAKGLSADKAKLLKRTSILSSLISLSDETQKGLIDLLEKAQDSGQVSSFQRFYIVNALAVTSSKEIMEQVATLPEVAKILPNEIKYFPNKLATRAIKEDAKTQAVEWNISQIRATEVWAKGITGEGTVIANIDTGVQWDHPALKEKYRGYNPSNPSQPDHTFSWYDATSAQKKAPYDDAGHGTHTMGTMVGSEPGNVNQVGVAPGAKWIAVRALSQNGGSDVDLIKAGEWILAPKDAKGTPYPDKAPDVVNNSWGGQGGKDEFYRQVVQNWIAADIFPEFSAGNSGPGAGSISVPANYPESFATAATDNNNKLADFSSRGPSPYGETKPEISAPGVSVRSAIPGNKYSSMNGTSMAGPHVSAVVALLRQANPSLTVPQLKQILISTAKPLTDSSYTNTPNNGYGAGLVDAMAAVNAVKPAEEGKVAGTITDKENNTPVQATVTVIETGKAVQSNADGKYALAHKPGEYTLKVQAVGFKTEEQRVSIVNKGEVRADFVLQKVPKGTLTGIVTDKDKNVPVEAAKAQLLLANKEVVSVTTDNKGKYNLQAPAGKYILRVSAAKYATAEVEVGLVENEAKAVDVSLKPITEYSSVISYDNDNHKGILSFTSKDDGAAVKMTLEEGKTSAKLDSASVKLWGVSEDNQFSVTIFDATGPNGAPGKQISKPVIAKVALDKNWNTVDLSGQNIVVPKDFYVQYAQLTDFSNSAIFLADDNTTSSNRNWIYFSQYKYWGKSNNSGNYMIRAKVIYDS